MEKYRYNYFKFSSLLICFFFLPHQTKSNSIDSIIAFGDSLYNRGSYIPALHEYKRANFFADSTQKLDALSRMANTYFSLADFTSARIYYDSASLYSINEKLKTDYFFQKLVCYMSEGEYAIALIRLDQKPGLESEYYRQKKELYYGICYFGLGQYESAYQHLKNSIPKADSLRHKQLKKQFEEHKKLRRPNEKIAVLLSIVIPGAGQLYAGNIKESLNSVLLVGGILCVGILSPSINNYLTLPFFYRYYIGGIAHARQIALDKQLRKKEEFYLSLDLFDPSNSDSTYLGDIFNNCEPEAYYSIYLQESDTQFKLLSALSFLFYKEFISSQDVNACVFEPSCSIYMMEAVKNEGMIIGFLDGFDRLLRCHFLVSEKEYVYIAKTGRYYDPH